MPGDPPTSPPHSGAMPAPKSGAPMKLTGVEFDGVAAETIRKGAEGKIWVKLAMTSDAASFHRILDGFDRLLAHHFRNTGIRAGKANIALLVIHEDKSADLWIDSVAVIMRAIVKRDLSAGEAIFDSDITDVTHLEFPDVTLKPTDRIFCVFRQDWRFGLYFDLRGKDFDREAMARELGSLYRIMAYRHLYDLMADETLFSQLAGAGWFPFAEILGTEFRNLMDHCIAGFDLSDAEAELLAKFDDARIDRMFKRWLARQHFAVKEPILASAIRAFKAKDPVATLKIVLTEIEGVLVEAYRARHGKVGKRHELLQFATDTAEAKAGGTDTLMFPAAFGRYLRDYAFANFDPDKPRADSAGSRHAVGHGAASAESYTQVRALMALLTLDQLAFYLS